MRYLSPFAGLAAATFAVILPGAAAAQPTSARPVETTFYWDGGSPTQTEINGLLSSFSSAERQLGAGSQLPEPLLSDFRRQARQIRYRLRYAGALSSRDRFSEVSQRVARLENRIRAAGGEASR